MLAPFLGANEMPIWMPSFSPASAPFRRDDMSIVKIEVCLLSQARPGVLKALQKKQGESYLEYLPLKIRRRSILFLFFWCCKFLRSLPLRRCLRFLLSGKCSDEENWRRSGKRRRPPLSFGLTASSDSFIMGSRTSLAGIYFHIHQTVNIFNIIL